MSDEREELFVDGFVLGKALQGLVEDPYEFVLLLLASLEQPLGEQSGLFMDGMIEGTRNES